jgi:hypothetical protein
LLPAIGHYATEVNTSDLCPSLKMGQILALAIPMPAKDLSIIANSIILALVSVILCVFPSKQYKFKYCLIPIKK